MPLSPFLDPANIGGNPNANFSTVGGGMAATPVVSSLYDYDPFSIMRAIFMRHGDRPTFLQSLDMMGPDFNRGVKAPTTGHYEMDWLDSLVKIGSIVTASAGAGTSVVVALHADMMYNPSVTVGGVAAQASYPRVRQIIQFPNGKKAQITVKNTAVTPHRLTLTPLVTTVDLAGAITAGNSYFISDNAWAQGSGLPPGVLSRIYAYTNTFQITKEAFGITGTEMTNETFAQLKEGENGSIMLQLDYETVRRFERARSGALLWGQQINNITDTATAVDYDIPISGTEGFISWITTNAHTDTYTAGSYAIADFYAVTSIMEQENIGTSHLLTYDGYSLWVEREQVLQAFFAESIWPAMMTSVQNAYNLVYDDWDPSNDKDFVAWLGFRGYHVGGYTVFFKKMQEFSEAVGAGAAGYDFDTWSIYVPLTRVKDRSTGLQRPMIGYEWKQLGRYSRKAVIADLAGAGVGGHSGGYREVAVNEFDAYRCGFVSELAFHGATANKIVVQKAA